MPDGVVLKGTFFAAAKAGPGVLLLHQCDEQRKVWDVLGDSLVASGVNVLTVDYRGYGESGGSPHDKLTPAEAAKVAEVLPSDIDSAFAYLVRQPGVDSAAVGAGGGSCGVNNATGVALRHPRVKALLLLAGPLNRTGRLFLHTSKALPVFAAAAQDDKYYNFVQTSQWLFGVSTNPLSRLAQYPTGGHAAVMFGTNKELPGIIAHWFAATLGNTPQSVPTTNGIPLAPDVLPTLDKIDLPGGAAQVATSLKDARARKSTLVMPPEAFINQVGYEHIVDLKDTKGAIEIMKLNAEAYPDSPNTQDSLGDAYLADGQKDQALLTARKTLELVPKDTVDTAARKKLLQESAEGRIKQLTARK
jgi:dienelactone hydrolase